GIGSCELVDGCHARTSVEFNGAVRAGQEWINRWSNERAVIGAPRLVPGASWHCSRELFLHRHSGERQKKVIALFGEELSLTAYRLAECRGNAHCKAAV